MALSVIDAGRYDSRLWAVAVPLSADIAPKSGHEISHMSAGVIAPNRLRLADQIVQQDDVADALRQTSMTDEKFTDHIPTRCTSSANEPT